MIRLAACYASSQDDLNMSLSSSDLVDKAPLFCFVLLVIVVVAIQDLEAETGRFWAAGGEKALSSHRLRKLTRLGFSLLVERLAKCPFVRIISQRLMPRDIQVSRRLVACASSEAASEGVIQPSVIFLSIFSQAHVLALGCQNARLLPGKCCLTA